MYAIIIMCIIVLLMPFVINAYASVMHELGHFRCAYKMQQCEGIILVRQKVIIPFRLPGVRIVAGCKEIKPRGITELSNEFQAYSAGEVSKIAKAGHKAEAWWCVICGITAIILEVLIATAMSTLDSAAWEYGSVMLVCIGLITLATTVLYGPIAYTRSGKSEWGDKTIAENPEKYIDYKAGRKDYERLKRYLKNKEKEV